MNDIERLRKLLHHWREHNEEHASVYREWAEKMAGTGRKDISAVLERLSGETTGLNRLIDEAEDLTR